MWPPKDAPVYEGKDPSEGTLYTCAKNFVGVGVVVVFITDGDAPVDPRVLVEQASKALPLEHAQAKVAPSSDFHTYVHLDNWLWVPEGQWHPAEVTVSAGSISVTAVAVPLRVEWDMGTEVVPCADQGRAWVKGMTDAAKTACSYAYETLDNPAGDVHDVSARIVYEVTWTCAGPCTIQAGSLGEFTAPAGDTTTIEVRQRQTVVTQ